MRILWCAVNTLSEFQTASLDMSISKSHALLIWLHLLETSIIMNAKVVPLMYSYNEHVHPCVFLSLNSVNNYLISHSATSQGLFTCHQAIASCCFDVFLHWGGGGLSATELCQFYISTAKMIKWWTHFCIQKVVEAGLILHHTHTTPNCYCIHMDDYSTNDFLCPR